MKKILLSLCLPLALFASDDSKNLVYSTVGTTGIGVGYSYSINDKFAIRADLNYIGFGVNKDINDLNADSDLSMFNFGVFADYSPFNSGFFLSVGALIGDNSLKSTIKPSGNLTTITINGKNYNYDITQDKLEFEAKYDTFRPYVGLGYKSQSRGFGFFADAGLAYGKAKASYKVTENLGNLAGNDIKKEFDDFQNDLNDYKVFPILKIGISYRF